MGNIAIYATKGFEYLLILGFLGAFVTFYLFLTSRYFQPVVARVGQGLNAMMDWFHVPEGFLFHQGHTWAQADPADPGTVRVGLDDFAQKLVGKVDIVATTKVGSQLKQGGRAWGLWVGPKLINMVSPVSGQIVEVNEAIQENAALLNDDPFGNGWIYKVRPEGLAREAKNLLSGKLAFKWMEEAVDKLRLRMVGEAGLVYQDGGVPMPGIAKNIDWNNWDRLARDLFLSE
ncbi:MAG: glycine cleavage system protein H [Thermodesulfobacteriota bacterium]